MPFVWDYLGELVSEEIFTHSHLSWLSSILHQFPPSTTIHSNLPVQFTCLIVFLHNLPPSPLWPTSWSGTSTSYSTYFFIHSLSSFCNTCPYHCNLFCSVPTLSSIRSLSLNSTWNCIFYLNVTSIWPVSSLPAEMPSHFLSLKARSHFHAT